MIIFKLLFSSINSAFLFQVSTQAQKTCQSSEPLGKECRKDRALSLIVKEMSVETSEASIQMESTKGVKRQRHAIKTFQEEHSYVRQKPAPKM